MEREIDGTVFGFEAWAAKHRRGSWRCVNKEVSGSWLHNHFPASHRWQRLFIAPKASEKYFPSFKLFPSLSVAVDGWVVDDATVRIAWDVKLMQRERFPWMFASPKTSFFRKSTNALHIIIHLDLLGDAKTRWKMASPGTAERWKLNKKKGAFYRLNFDWSSAHKKLHFIHLSFSIIYTFAIKKVGFEI